MNLIHLSLALDELHEDLAFWVHYNDPQSKRSLLRRYEELPDNQRNALAAAVERAFEGRTLLAYRRMKTGDSIGRMSGASLSTDVPNHADYETFELMPEDVLLHWAVTYPDGSKTALSSRSFGHEHEVILRPGAHPRHVGSSHVVTAKDLVRNAVIK